MKFKTLIKLGTFSSVFLFCVAVGFYAFTHLTLIDQNRSIDLFSLVPADSEAVVESENVDAFFKEYSQLNYHEELKNIHFPELFSFLLNQLNTYATENAHGLSSQMNHVLVSYHDRSRANNQVIYFRKGFADEAMLTDMLREFSSNEFLIKKETYRGESILIHPLGTQDFLSVFSGKGFFAVSYQKELIEKVIDTYLDKTSVKENKQFAKLISKKKTPHYLTYYTRNFSLPFLKDKEPERWCEYDFHISSDVLFITGESIWDDDSGREQVECSLRDVETMVEKDAFVSSDKDSIQYYMNLAQENCEGKDMVLHNECMAALSHDASFALVANMEKVFEEKERFEPYIPTFITRNEKTFRHFLLSTQLTFVENRPSCIWVLTYGR